MIRFRLPAERLDPERASAWSVGSGSTAIVLVHGFAGSPAEFRYFGARLADYGFVVAAPLVKGHGTSVLDMHATKWRAWATSIQSAIEDLLRDMRHVVVVGQSMGALLALHLAAQNPAISAVGTMAAPLRLSGVGPRMVPYAKFLVPGYEAGGDVDLFRREGLEELYGYGIHSLSAVHELLRLAREVERELATIRQPVFIAQGGRDRLVHPHNALELSRRLVCSRSVLQVTYPRSGHGLSVDIDRDHMVGEFVAWLGHVGVGPDLRLPGTA